MCYTFGYTFGYLCEQVAIGALSAGSVKVAQVAAKGVGPHLAANLARRTAAAVASRAQMLKRMLAEAVKLPDDILALFQQRLSMAGVGPTGEGMLKVPLEVLQEGAESARFNFKQYFDSVFDSPKLNKFLRQGDAAAQKAANSFLLDRMAQMKTILGDEFTETLQKNFTKVVEDVILVRRPDGNVESFFEAFLKAFEGNPSLMKHADELSTRVGGPLEPMSAEAKATLKKFLSDPNAGKLWEIDVPAIVDNEPAVPHNYWVRGILAELSIYKRFYKAQGYTHFPNASAFDLKSAAEYVQIKTLKNPDGAFGAMKKAVDALALLPSPPDGLKLHILKKPGSGSDQLETALRNYINTSPNQRVKQVQLEIQSYELAP
jgi:hypothetical protein